VTQKNRKIERFKTELGALQKTIPEDLHLPSLRENRLQGYASLFMIVLPLLKSKGEPVFTEPLLQELFIILDIRFGGCLVPSAGSHPPYWGLWHPTEHASAERDYLTTIQIFTNPIEAADEFFASLKQILKTAGNIEQGEILVSRIECRLL
jgi:hypothetical protein